MDEVPPPWVALPDLDPDEPATHGMPEVYIMLNWWPYWRTLSPEEKAAYLDRWNASPHWREVIAEQYDPRDDIDYEAEARENAEWRRAHGRDLPPRPWWRFWS